MTELDRVSAVAPARGPRPSEHPLLEYKDLGFRYTHDSEKVLQGLTLSIEPRTMVLVMGPTGCGKTTAVLASNGLVPVATGGQMSGDVLVDGKSTRTHGTHELASTVSVVFQDPEGQMCTLFVEDEIAFAMENLKVDPDRIRERIQEMLQFIQMEGLAKKPVYDLSGGQKQKLNFASVLAMEPRLLIADMPTANLDPLGTEEVFSVLRALVSQGDKTCIVVENRVDDLLALADRVVVLGEGGTVQCDGTPTEVFGNHGLALRDEVGVQIPQIVELALALRERGCDVGVPLTVDEVVEGIREHFCDGDITIKAREGEEDEEEIVEGKKPVIMAEDVRYTYPDGTEALKGVSFKVEQGEVLAIVGNNGSGKTTLAKHLVGLLCSSEGSVEVVGLDPAACRIKDVAEKVTYVFQYPDQQFVTQTVYDEVAFNLRNRDLTEKEVECRVETLLERFQLTEFRERSPFLLSGGEMRTLSVACMLAVDPEVVILDEPTYGQDWAHISALMERLQEQRRRGSSIVMITHDMRLVAEYATRVVVMSGGHVLFDGSPQGLFFAPDVMRQADLKPPPICTVANQLEELGMPVPPNAITTVDDFLSLVTVK